MFHSPAAALHRDYNRRWPDALGATGVVALPPGQELRTYFDQCMIGSDFEKKTQIIADKRTAVRVRAEFGTRVCDGSHEHRIMSSDDQSGDDERMTIASFDDDATSAFGSNASSSNMTLVQLVCHADNPSETRQRT